MIIVIYALSMFINYYKVLQNVDDDWLFGNVLLIWNSLYGKCIWFISESTKSSKISGTFIVCSNVLLPFKYVFARHSVYLSWKFNIYVIELRNILSWSFQPNV